MDSGEPASFGLTRGLWHGRVDTHREHVLPLWAGLGTLCWFLYMLLFVSIAAYLYYEASQPVWADYLIGAFIALNAGALIGIYVNTLADGTHRDEADDKHPFALSLQATFFEAVTVAGTTLTILGIYLLEHFKIFGVAFLPALDGKFDANNIDILARNVEQSSHEPYLLGLLKTLTNDTNTFWITIALLVLFFFGIMVVAHNGFVLLKRRHAMASEYNGTYRNEGDPPISSRSLKQRISHLRQLRSDLLGKAEREATLALKHEQRAVEAQTRQAEAAKLSDALVREADAFTSDHAAYAVTLVTVHKQRDDLLAKADDPARSLGRKFLRKIADAVESAIGLLNAGDHTFEDTIASLKAQAETADAEGKAAEAAVAAHQACAGEHHAESTRLTEEAEVLAAEIEELDTLAQQIDDTNEEWSKPYDWTAKVGARSVEIDHVIPAAAYHAGKMKSTPDDKLDDIHRGTRYLFIFATLFLVIDDLLFDTFKFGGHQRLPGLNAGNLIEYAGLAFLLLAVLWVMKSFSILGFMGSWRAIMSAPQQNNVDRSRMLNVLAANFVAVAAFSVVVFAIVIALQSAVVALQPAAGAAPSEVAHRMTLLLAGFRYLPILPFLGSVAGLVIAAPAAVYVFERYVRDNDRYRGLLRQLQFAALVLGVVFAVAIFGGLFMWFGGVARSGINVPKIPGPVVPPAPVPETQITCPLTSFSNVQGGINGTWVFKNVTVVERHEDLDHCSFSIGTVGQDKKIAKYIIVVSAASQEGNLSEEVNRSNTRSGNILKAIQRSYAKAKQNSFASPLDVYVVSLGQYTPKLPGLQPDTSGYQRPAFLIVGTEEKETDRFEGANRALATYANIHAAQPDTLGAYDNYPATKSASWKVERHVLCSDGKLLDGGGAVCPVPSGKDGH